ncbi:hypothetical protein EUX98_g5059 [Antrodiella citrinella]|uniref:Uncharacterized protein n=1 Tax=Antrodiella citrinella TaxID=2447956 RepID=A0A4S4MTE9_9APHY|nr:hypothetical protein EUX98_g5059 [Antrodiella citrinella]
MQIFKALHTAYRRSVANPFLRLNAPTDNITDHALLVSSGAHKWKLFRERVDEIAKAIAASAVAA